MNFIGTLYSLGATLSFTIAHASVVRLRMVERDESEIVYLAYPNLRVGRVDWPLFAVAGGIATGTSFLVLVVQNETTRWVGLGWMLAGLAGYAVYRRRFVHSPIARSSRRHPLSARRSRSSTGGSSCRWFPESRPTRR